jgi:hypothetical protein
MNNQTTSLWVRRMIWRALPLILAACSGGGGGDSPAPAPNPTPTPPPPSNTTVVTAVNGLISAPSVFAANCGVANGGTVYTNAEIEPHIAINPANPNNLIASWQQDRWSNGGAQGTTVAATLNGGQTWTLQPVKASNCGGGTAANGGNFERATDPWVAFSPNGTAYQMSLAFSGASLTAGSSSAMLVFRSTDGGLTWGTPATLISDGANFFNDKNTITADPTDSRFVYAVWDRLTNDNRGPLMFARTTDGGLTWEPARAIYDPGTSAQTIGTVIGVLPNGTLVNLFVTLRTVGGVTRGEQTVMRSTDKGATWSAPIKVADFMGIGGRDPDTGAAIRDGGYLPQIAVGPQGQVHAVWQDARFSAGARDAIVLSTSTDGGLTWGAPQRVSANVDTQALIGSVNVRADGVVGVSYFDLRNNTADPATLLTDHWLVTSRDLSTWSETRITPASFNYANAPVARGLFLGDYMGLVSSGNTFYPLHTRATNDLNNRTDVFVQGVTVTVAQMASTASVAMRAPVQERFVPTATMIERSSEFLQRALEARTPGWRARHGLPTP